MIPEILIILFVVLVILGTYFLHNLTTPRRYTSSQQRPQEREKDTLAEDNVEDSEGDGLMSEGDLWFPEELPEDNEE